MSDKPMTFQDHKETTAKDCEAIALQLTELAASVRQGDLRAFEAWWLEGGTEEGDAKILSIREIMILRYAHRNDSLLEKPAKTSP